MYNQLIQHQNEVHASILATIEHSFKGNTDAAFKPHAKQVNLSTPATSVGAAPNRAVGVVQAISSTKSTSNSTSIDNADCYMNWDRNKHGKLSELKFVNYKELHVIFDHIWAKVSRLHGSVRRLTPEDMTNARKSIAALNVSTVNKYQRYPSNGNFIDINLTSKNNTELKGMFETTNADVFYNAARSYQNVIEQNVLDQWVFENTHGLKWIL